MEVSCPQHGLAAPICVSLLNYAWNGSQPCLSGHVATRTIIAVAPSGILANVIACPSPWLPLEPLCSW